MFFKYKTGFDGKKVYTGFRDVLLVSLLVLVVMCKFNIGSISELVFRMSSWPLNRTLTFQEMSVVVITCMFFSLPHGFLAGVIFRKNYGLGAAFAAYLTATIPVMCFNLGLSLLFFCSGAVFLPVSVIFGDYIKERISISDM